jgi:hypothetical protein
MKVSTAFDSVGWNTKLVSRGPGVSRSCDPIKLEIESIIDVHVENKRLVGTGDSEVMFYSNGLRISSSRIGYPYPLPCSES